MHIDTRHLSKRLYETLSHIAVKTETPQVIQGGYAYRHKTFVWVNCNPELSNKYEADVNKSDWKLHIAVEPSLNNVCEAFNIVLKAGIKHRILQFKCYEAEILPKCIKHIDDDEQARKIMTVYFYEGRPDQDEAIKSFMLDVENGFRRERIKPGPHPESEIVIEGSRFFSYRDFGGDDPFKDFAIPAKISPRQKS